MQKYLEVGKVINTHGVRGEIKVIPLTDDPNRFYDLNEVFVEKNNSLIKHKIEGVKLSKNTVILKLSGIDSMDDAEALRNFYLKIDRKDAVSLPEDSFFISDLIDCTVYDLDGQRLGLLKDVLQTGSNDVYLVKNESGKEILIPALKSVVHKVSVSERSITVAIPEGLVDDEV